MTPLQLRRRTEHETRFGRRPSHSPVAVRQVLARLAAVVPRRFVLESDEKPLYGALSRRLFGSRCRWRTHSAAARRDRSNPLFPINDRA
jgi:hypothetical protein